MQCEDIIENGTYYISSALKKSKVISIENGDYKDLSNAYISEKKDKEYQKFTVTYNKNEKSYTIVAAHSNKALDVCGAGQDNSTNVDQYHSNNTQAQNWVIKSTDDGYYNIISKCNELCLDVAGGKTTNGTNLQTYENNGTKAQKFQFIKAEINIGNQTIEDGIYNIVPKLNEDKVVEIEKQSEDNYRKIQINRKLTVFNKSQKFEIHYLENGYYYIKSYKSGKPLEVENGAHDNSTSVQQNSESNSNIQQWIIKESDEEGYYNIISRCNGLYLNIPGEKANDGTKLQVYEENNSNAQKFKFEICDNIVKSEKEIEDGYYIIKTKLDSNKVLDISGGSNNNNANLQIWDKDNVQQQKFKIVYNQEGEFYEIQSANSGKFIDVSGNGKNDGTNVAQYKKNNTIAQRWIIQKADNDSYYIMALNSNLYMDVCGGNIANGTNLQIFEGNESNAQKFIFEPTTSIDERVYKISIKKDKNKCLDIAGGSNAENANLQIWSKDNVNQQVFSVDSIDNQYYKIIARNSNKALTVTSENNVVQAEYNNLDNQLWKIDIVENGYFKIISKANDLRLDVEGNNTDNGTNVQVFQDNTSTAQLFKFETLTTRNGIDVSSHNGSINWELVKLFGKMDYAIIRAGYRGYRTGKIVTDDYFVQNSQEARANNIDIGLYFFTQAINTQEAIEEANYVINLVRKYNLRLNYPIYIDTEASSAENNTGRADYLDKNTRTAICRAFCDTIRSNGYKAGIYASKNWFYNKLDVSQLGEYEIWVAHYKGSADNPTDYKYKYDMWQYTNYGNVPGVNTLVDMNICYKKY